ncbi:serine hydrolase domain-containing protein [Amycolatopsis rhabdoformis]|uniref:Serine hydrolase domain-containing protein n=1 Tax=Amycolatopsis rhabdoformis TaxID=1448059 RepID=A0ABZ1HVB0_9PSEU|nr:serine hydrolase domain-containing protein [Amycolatopsis rhabdoformis]WSE26249.1 serine hydrolase domain-containing protein [Amycolatopsis rhabdoformis]
MPLPTPAPVHGEVAEGFEPVAEAFRQNFTDRDELGAAVAVVVRGRTVVDLWGGWTDETRRTPWQRPTLTNVWSATKGLVALCALQLVESDDLDLDAPVARYWPEFAAAGKAAIPVRWLLSHRSGVTGVSPEHPVQVEDLLDWPKMTGLLAAQEPLVEPGSASGYHALSYGFLVGEVIARITGQTVGEFFRANVARPLNVDVHIGVSPDDLARCSTVVEPAPGPGPERTDVVPDRATLAALANPIPRGTIANLTRWRVAEVPAANGHGTAHGLATVYGALADGSERLLRHDTIELGRTGQGRCRDLVMGLDNEFGLGFCLGSEQLSFGPNPRGFGHDGFGGSTGFADPESGVGFGYVMNRMGTHLRDDPRKMALVEATYASLALSLR